MCVGVLYTGVVDGVMVSFDRVSMDTISDMYTRLRSGGHGGRSFVFEGERLPVGYAGRLAGLKG